MLRAAWPRRLIVSSTLPAPAKGRLSIATRSALDTERPSASVIAPERTRATVRSSSTRSISCAIMRSRNATKPALRERRRRRSQAVEDHLPAQVHQRQLHGLGVGRADVALSSTTMHSSAGGCGSSPAPVARYMPSSCSWNASSNSSCRCCRRNPNSARTRVSRFISIFSCGDSSTGGVHRCILVPPASTRSCARAGLSIPLAEVIDIIGESS